MIYDREYAKENLKKIMKQLYENNDYYASIEYGEKKYFEEDYRKSYDPDGVYRDLSNQLEIDRVFHENPDVFNYILEKEIIQFGNKKNILDVGCGCGPFLTHVSKNWNKFGIEISKHASMIAKNKLPDATIENLDFMNNTYDDEYFDIILCHQVLEHIRKPDDFLNEFNRILKPGGSIILCVPNFDSGCARLFGKNYRFFHDDTHITLFSYDSLSRLVRDTGFKIVNIEYPYFESEKYFNIDNLKRLKNTKLVSPPFYGNLMTMYAVKK